MTGRRNSSNSSRRRGGDQQKTTMAIMIVLTKHEVARYHSHLLHKHEEPSIARRHNSRRKERGRIRVCGEAREGE